MRGHFSDAAGLKLAAVSGDVVSVNTIAESILSRHAGDDPRYHPLEAAAKEAAGARDLPGASLAVARLLSHCGECHRNEGITLELTEHPPPTPQTPLVLHYAHAVDRMWEGLVVPSPSAWERGAERFGAALVCGAPAGVPEHHALPSQYCNSTLAISGAVRVATTADERAVAYADVLSMCAHCHETLAPTVGHH